MKLRYKVILSCLLIFSCFNFIFAYNEDQVVLSLREAINIDSAIDNSKDTLILRQRNSSNYQGRDAYSFVVYNADFYSKNASIYNHTGNKVVYYIDLETNKVIGREQDVFQGDPDRSTNLYLSIRNYNAQAKTYDVVVDDYIKQTRWDFVEANIMLEDLTLKKNFYFGKRLFLIGLLMEGIQRVLQIIKVIVKIAIIPLVGVICLIGSVRYFKRLSKYLLRL